MASELSIHGQNVKKLQLFDLWGQGMGREGIFPCSVEINSRSAFGARSGLQHTHGLGAISCWQRGKEQMNDFLISPCLRPSSCLWFLTVTHPDHNPAGCDDLSYHSGSEILPLTSLFQLLISTGDVSSASAEAAWLLPEEASASFHRILDLAGWKRP